MHHEPNQKREKHLTIDLTPSSHKIFFFNKNKFKLKKTYPI